MNPDKLKKIAQMAIWGEANEKLIAKKILKKHGVRASDIVNEKKMVDTSRHSHRSYYSFSILYEIDDIIDIGVLILEINAKNLIKQFFQK